MSYLKKICLIACSAFITTYASEEGKKRVLNQWTERHQKVESLIDQALQAKDGDAAKRILAILNIDYGTNQIMGLAPDELAAKKTKKIVQKNWSTGQWVSVEREWTLHDMLRIVVVNFDLPTSGTNITKIREALKPTLDVVPLATPASASACASQTQAAPLASISIHSASRTAPALQRPPLSAPSAAPTSTGNPWTRRHEEIEQLIDLANAHDIESDVAAQFLRRIKIDYSTGLVEGLTAQQLSAKKSKTMKKRKGGSFLRQQEEVTQEFTLAEMVRLVTSNHDIRGGGCVSSLKDALNPQRT